MILRKLFLGILATFYQKKKSLSSEGFKPKNLKV